jgi:hypothetical protein
MSLLLQPVPLGFQALSLIEQNAYRALPLQRIRDHAETGEERHKPQPRRWVPRLKQVAKREAEWYEENTDRDDESDRDRSNLQQRHDRRN